MPEKKRVDIGDVVYHVLNRSNGRIPIFENEKDYRAFEKILREAKTDVVDMRILAYCLMPNHFHMILYPRKDGDLSKFTQWVTATHAKRWRSFHDTVGEGHLYQGKFKSFPIETDSYFFTACRYVERNALRAALVKRAEDWPFSSIYMREYGTLEQQKLLNDWPVDMPEDYVAWVNEAITPDEVEALRRSVKRGTPFGSDGWKKQWVKTDEKTEK